MDDPFLEAKLITPFHYINVRYVQSKPRGLPQTFKMNRNTTFVINLDKDTERFRSFQRAASGAIKATGGRSHNNASSDGRGQSPQYYQFG